MYLELKEFGMGKLVNLSAGQAGISPMHPCLCLRQEIRQAGNKHCANQ